MSQLISLQDAAVLTERFRTHREAILEPTQRGKDLLPLCETFDRDVADRLLEQAGCTGLRIYYGMDEDLKIHAVLVGVGTEGQDLLPGAGTASGEPDPIGENANRCPPLCPAPSPLNT